MKMVIWFADEYVYNYLVYGVSVKDESSARVSATFGCSPVASDIVVAEPYHMRNTMWY